MGSAPLGGLGIALFQSANGRVEIRTSYPLDAALGPADSTRRLQAGFSSAGDDVIARGPSRPCLAKRERPPRAILWAMSWTNLRLVGPVKSEPKVITRESTRTVTTSRSWILLNTDMLEVASAMTVWRKRPHRPWKAYRHNPNTTMLKVRGLGKSKANVRSKWKGQFTSIDPFNLSDNWTSKPFRLPQRGERLVGSN